MNRKDRQKSFTTIVFILFFIISQASAMEAPILPTIIKGDLTIDNKPAPIGTTITAEIDGIPMGLSKTTQKGIYVIAVGGGFENNEKHITLYVNNIKTDTNTTWSSGKVETIDLAVTKSNTRYYIYALVAALTCFFVFMASRNLKKPKK